MFASAAAEARHLEEQQINRRVDFRFGRILSLVSGGSNYWDLLAHVDNPVDLKKILVRVHGDPPHGLIREPDMDPADSMPHDVETADMIRSWLHDALSHSEMYRAQVESIDESQDILRALDLVPRVYFEDQLNFRSTLSLLGIRFDDIYSAWDDQPSFLQRGHNIAARSGVAAITRYIKKCRDLLVLCAVHAHLMFIVETNGDLDVPNFIYTWAASYFNISDDEYDSDVEMEI
tara:strand:- start:4794 stop:5492 length:699 start_codon:yes stop_codon:yes gene_type:complete